MTELDEPVSMAERYGLATQSSHLKCEEGRCDLDYLIASGMSLSPLATALTRLRGEFDSAKGGMRLNRAEFILLLDRLPSLPTARRELSAFASVLATKLRFMHPDSLVMVLAGRALDVWLDVLCHACDGRGFNGGAHRGEPVIKCGGCAGFGHRRGVLGDSVEERTFSRQLLEAMAEVLRHGEDEMKRRLRYETAD